MSGWNISKCHFITENLMHSDVYQYVLITFHRTYLITFSIFSAIIASASFWKKLISNRDANIPDCWYVVTSDIFPLIMHPVVFCLGVISLDLVVLYDGFTHIRQGTQPSCPVEIRAHIMLNSWSRVFVANMVTCLKTGHQSTNKKVNIIMYAPKTRNHHWKIWALITA